jgi:hypothetical protein
MTAQAILITVISATGMPTTHAPSGETSARLLNSKLTA